MKLYSVDFEPVWPVGNCLLIFANNLKQAKEIASGTIKHTDVFEVEEVKMNKPGVILYMSGDY